MGDAPGLLETDDLAQARLFESFKFADYFVWIANHHHRMLLQLRVGNVLGVEI